MIMRIICSLLSGIWDFSFWIFPYSPHFPDPWMLD